MNETRGLKEHVAAILNEATVRAFEMDQILRRARLAVHALALPEDGGPAGSELEVRLSGVSRIAVSLRNGLWNDESAAVTPVGLDELQTVVESFGSSAIYGEEFLDSADDWLQRWGANLSLDWHDHDGTPVHTLDFFQEGPDRHLDVRIWFDDFQICDEKGIQQPLEALVAASDRWWSAMRRGDPRTAASGIIPLK